MDQNSLSENGSRTHARRIGSLLVAAALFVILIALLRLSRHDNSAPRPSTSGTGTVASTEFASEGLTGRQRLAHRRSSAAPTAEEIVANKVRQFGRSRREIVR